MAYAVIQTGGKQYRVAEGDVIEVEKLAFEPGADAKFEEVLLVSNGNSVSIGAPLVTGAAVTVEILEQTKAPKVIAFKYKRRKGYHRTVGHRRQLTRLKIKSITAIVQAYGSQKGTRKRQEWTGQRKQASRCEKVWRRVRDRRKHHSTAAGQQIPRGQ